MVVVVRLDNQVVLSVLKLCGSMTICYKKTIVQNFEDAIEEMLCILGSLLK